MIDIGFGAPRPGGALGRVLGGVTMVALLMLGAALAQTTSYVAATTPLLASAGGKTVGTLTPGTPVAVLATSGDDSQVRVTGWSLQGSDTVLFQDVGLRIVLLVLDGDAKVDRKDGQTKKDDYGSSWNQVTISGWVATKQLADSADAVWQRGQQLFESKCSSCHSLHSPDEFTANQWPGILKAMGKNAALNQEQLELITRFLQAHAKGQ